MNISPVYINKIDRICNVCLLPKWVVDTIDIVFIFFNSIFSSTDRLNWHHRFYIRAIVSLWEGRRVKKLSLLGLLAKIMCSICSFQLNIWNAPHWGACILNWFLNLGYGIGACSILATGWPGIAVPPGSAHPSGGNNKPKKDINKKKCFIPVFLK